MTHLFTEINSSAASNTTKRVNWNQLCDEAGVKFELLKDLSDRDLALIGTTRRDFAMSILNEMHT